jgi:hypothetical protein
MRQLWIMAGAVLLGAGCERTVDGHGTTSAPAGKKLSHSAVEQFIESRLGAIGVNCNGGQDFQMRADGDTFPCVDDVGHSYAVTIVDKDRGNYRVS